MIRNKQKKKKKLIMKKFEFEFEDVAELRGDDEASRLEIFTGKYRSKCPVIARKLFAGSALVFFSRATNA